MAGYAKYISLQRIKAWVSERITNLYNVKYEKTETTPITKVHNFFQLSSDTTKVTEIPLATE